MTRLSLDTWRDIFSNTHESTNEIEIIWLDSTDEWCIYIDLELFEDGFKTREEALWRLRDIENLILL